MKKSKLLLASTGLLLSLFLLGACGSSSDSKTKDSNETKQSTTAKKDKVDLNKLELPQLNKEVADNEALVEMVTTEGNIKIKLFPEQAPKAVENFIKHSKDGYYNGVKFHRIMNDFMIQSGDPKGDGTGGESIWKEEFAPEISNQLYHLDGALSMARTGGEVSQKTQGSQFYIVHNTHDVSDGLLSEDYPEKIIEAYKKGGTPTLDFNYSVFGQVIDGMDIVDKIAKTEVEASPNGEMSVPKKEIKIEKIEVLQEAKK
ncbi:peptidylprolyl isomerase [Vagococcus carniphilus]|uniref:peptidylprolyl isomerase n=1 Tax=Vagococcus carniphilus TaxID=218144 RepID=UPI003BAB2721